jgi:hypothetical protein
MAKKTVSFKTSDGRNVKFKAGGGRDNQGKVEKPSLRDGILGISPQGFVEAGLAQRLHDVLAKPGQVPSGKRCCRCGAYGRMFTKGDDDPKLYCTKCAKEN